MEWQGGINKGPTTGNGVRASFLEIRTGIPSWLPCGNYRPFCSDSPEWRSGAHDFQRHGDAFGTTANAFFRAFITLRSQFHLHHHSQRTLTEIMSKKTCPWKGLFSFHPSMKLAQLLKVWWDHSKLTISVRNTFMTKAGETDLSRF